MEMALVDPMLPLRSTGSGRLFWVSGVSGVQGALGHDEVHSRIKPDDVCGKLRYQNAVLFFMESRNLHTLKSVSYTHLTLPTICSV